MVAPVAPAVYEMLPALSNPVLLKVVLDAPVRFMVPTWMAPAMVTGLEASVVIFKILLLL